MTAPDTLAASPTTAALTTSAAQLAAALGVDLTNPDLAATPRRWMEGMQELTSGQHMDPVQLLGTVFDAPECRPGSIVLSANLPYVSVCEHHLMPFMGTAHVAYVPAASTTGPGVRVVGLSKLARALGAVARRPQMQERLGAQLADALTQALAPEGVAVLLTGRHTCQELRGVRSRGVMVTECVTGVFHDPHVRANLHRMIDEARREG